MPPNKQRRVTRREKKETKKAPVEEQVKKIDEPVLKFGSGKSTNPCYYIRLLEDNECIVPDMAEVRRELRASVMFAEHFMAVGDFENALYGISVTVAINPRSEEMLNKYKQRLTPDQYARVVEQIKTLKFYDTPNSDDYNTPNSDENESIDQQEEEQIQETSEQYIRRRDVMEKVFDILPPEHFAFCLEKFRSLRESLEEYISYGTSMSNIRNFDVTKAPNTANCNAESNQKMNKKKIERPDSISSHIWKKFYNLAENVADFVLDAFAMFESGDFANWNKSQLKVSALLIAKDNQGKTRKRRNLVCEYVLIERMKEKEFFCCVLCEEILFNWRQALIHFASNTHRENEKCVANAYFVEGFRGVLNSVTDLPMKLCLSDFQSYVDGGIVHKDDGFPSDEFIDYLYEGYWPLGTIEVNTLNDEQRTAMENNKLVFKAETMIARAKSEMGVEAMNELHEHLGLGETYCHFCCSETWSQEGFYAHLLSSIHVHNVNASMWKWEDESITWFCLLTILVNVHRKDLI